tara:strand:- start:8986 stop:10851 length:1866 start_codon:yes stop_codon:yes gene_type:complete
MNQTDLNNISIRVNLNYLIFSFYFICFGVYGSLSPSVVLLKKNIIYHLCFEILILLIPILYYFYLKIFKDVFFSFLINNKIIFVIVLSLTIFVPLSIYPVTYGLFSDEQSYVMSAHEQSMQIILRTAFYFKHINDFQINYLVRFLSFFLSIYVIFNIYIFQKIKLKSILIYVFISTIILRLAYIQFGGHMSPHPSMNLVPHLFSGTFLGFSPFVFKFIVLIIFITWSVYLIEKVKIFNSVILKYLLFFIILTLPIINELKYTVEPSLWTFMLFVYIGSSLLHDGYKNYNKLIMITVLVCFFRQPSFLALVPIFVSELFYLYKRKINWNIIFLLIKKYTPLILFIPYLVNSVFLGTGMTTAFLDGPYQQFDHYFPSLSDIYNYSIISVPHIYILTLPFFFSIILIKNIKKLIVFVFFFSALILIYYSIIPPAWGLAKYQAEYMLPFFIFSLIIIVKNIKFKFLKILFLLFFLLTNFYYLAYPLWQSRNKNPDSSQIEKPAYYAGLKFNYIPIINQLIKDNSIHTLAFLGSDYKSYPVLSSTISVENYKMIVENKKNMLDMINFDGQNWNVTSKNFKHITNIILESVPNKTELIQKLISMDWQIESTIKNKEHNTSVVWLKRN